MSVIANVAAERVVQMRKLEAHVIIQAVSEIVYSSVPLSLDVAGHVIKVQTIEFSHISYDSFVEDIAS